MTSPGPQGAGPEAEAAEEIWLRMSPWLDELLVLDPPARGAWIDELAQTDPATATHLRSYLNELKQLDQQNFLAGEEVSPLAATLAGQRLGPYTLERCLGHGGMGTVWSARRDDGRFQGRVAIKLLNASLVGHPAEQRFVREGTVLARVQHPNIAHLLDAGIAAGSQPYLVLEYVEGERLDRYCELHALSIPQRLALFLEVLAAVAHAHRNLIVHRDLKPTNILVTAEGRVKLLDFGVAALLDQQDVAEITRLSPPGLTVAYAAPEQIRGEAVTTATDVYALGIILLQLLTGRPPKLAESRTAEALQTQLDVDRPLASSLVDDPRLSRTLRGDLDNIVTLATRKEPQQRYATVESFAHDLRRYLAHEPVSARADSLAYRIRKFVRRHRGAVAASAFMGLLLVGATVLTSVQSAEARKQRDQARFESRRAELANDFLNVLLMSDGGPDRPLLKPTERLDRGVEMLEKQYRADPAFFGRMLIQLANQYRGSTETRRAGELYERAYQIGRERRDIELMVSAQCSHAYADSLAGIAKSVSARLAESETLLREVAADATLQASCLLAHAQQQARTGNPHAAEMDLRRAMQLMETEGSEHRPIYVKAITDLGGVYLRNNQPASALQMAELAGRVHERNGRGDTSARLTSMQNAVIALGAMGEARRALEQYEIVLQRMRELEPEDEAPSFYAVNHSGLLLRMDRPEQALRAVEPVMARARASGNPLALMRVLRASAAALLALGRIDESASLADEAYAIAQGVDEGNLALMEILEAQVALARDDAGAARTHIRAALSHAGYGRVQPHSSLGQALITATQVALRVGELEDAERFGRDALKATEALARAEDTSADVGEALLRLAQVRLAQGAKSEARELLMRGERCFANGFNDTHARTREARDLLQGRSSK
jgi:eukaryotic-like serine/threonine-protein kinase